MGEPLTWRDVAAPDFNTALGAYKVAGDQMTAAGQAVSKGLDSFQTNSENDAANALAAASAKYTDQASLKAAMANGSLVAQSGANPGALTAAAYKGQDDRVTQLLAQATGQQALDHNTAMDPLLQASQKAATASADASTALTGTQVDFNKQTMASRVNQSAAELTAKNLANDTTKASNEDVDDNVLAKNIASGIAGHQTTYAGALAELAKVPRGGEDGFDEGTAAKVLANLPGLMKANNPTITDPPTPTAGGQGGQGQNGAVAGLNQAVAPSATLPDAVGSGPNTGSQYTTGGLVALYMGQGATPAEAQKLAAISMAESGGKSWAHNTNADTGDNSYGLAQINMLGKMGPDRLAHYGLTANNDLLDPKTNARVALQMSRENGGYNDWSTYKNGKYKDFEDTASAATNNPNSQEGPTSVKYPGNNEAIRNQYYGGLHDTNDAVNRLGQAGTQLNSSGLAQQYARLTGIDPATGQVKNEQDVDSVVKDLQAQNPNTWGKLDAWKLADKVKDIQQSSTANGRSKSQVSAAVAAAIMAHADNGKSFSIFDPSTIGLPGSVNTNKTAENDALDLAQKGGGLNQINQTTKQYETQAAVLKSQQDAVSKAYKDLADAQIAKNQGRAIPDEVIAQKNADFQAKQAALAKLHAAVAGIQPDTGQSVAAQQQNAPQKPGFFASGSEKAAYAQAQRQQ